MRRGALMIVTDSRYVSGGVQAMAVRRSVPFSTCQDLWAAAVALGGGREALARWVPAHRRAPDPPLLSAGDWAGKARADALATQALARSQPPDVLLAAALAAAHEYRAVVAIGAAALEAQLAWAHAGIATGPTRFPRKRRRVRFVPRPRRPVAAYLGPPGPVLPAVPGHTRPAGMHTLCIGLGPDGGASLPTRGLRALCAAAGPVGAPRLLPLCRPGCGLGGRPAPGVGAGVPPHDPCGPAGRAECPLACGLPRRGLLAPLVPCAPDPCGRVGCGR